MSYESFCELGSNEFYCIVSGKSKRQNINIDMVDDSLYDHPIQRKTKSEQIKEQFPKRLWKKN